MCLKVLKNGAWIEDPPPSRALFFSASLTEFVGSRVAAQKNVGKYYAKTRMYVFIFKMDIGYVGGNEALMFRPHTKPPACLVCFHSAVIQMRLHQQ